MATRTPVATEAFTFSNGNLSSGDWTQLNQWDGAVKIYTNRFGTDNGVKCPARWNGTGTFTNDQYALCKIYGAASFGLSQVGVIVRASADTHTGVDGTDYYFAAINDNGGTNSQAVLGKVVNGTRTDILTSDSRVWAAGDALALEAEGTVLRVYQNATLIYSTTDASLTTGKPGIFAYAPSSSTALVGDDWEGGNLTAGGSSIAPLAAYYRMLRSA
jgi:hypothetical protein